MAGNWFIDEVLADIDAEELNRPIRDKFITTAQLKQIDPPKPLVAQWLFKNTLAWIAGNPGSYKSFLALHIASCVALGIPMTTAHGPRNVEQGNVLYVTAEGVSGMGKRVEAWAASYGMGNEPDITWLPEAVDVMKPEWDKFIDAANDVHPSLIVLDTQSRMTPGLEENKADQMSMFIRRLDRLRVATRACVLVLHHSAKSGTQLRGSSVIDGAADTIITLDRPDEDAPEAIVRCTKQKDGERFKAAVYEPVRSVQSIILQKSNDQSLAEHRKPRQR